MIFVRPIFSTLLTDDNYKIDGERTASQLLGCLDRDWVYRRWNTGGEAVRAWYTKSEVFADGDEEGCRLQLLMDTKTSTRSPLGCGRTVTEAEFPPDHHDATLYAVLLRGLV